MRISRAAVAAAALLAAACGEQTATNGTEMAAASAARGLTPGSRPNILLIVGDDLGYLDIGYYGSEIRTPNIDALAAQGVILTNFYSSVACQPTRAMLMSGAHNHLAGVGSQGRVVEGNPRYQNRLSDRVVSLADRMRDAGYNTYMSGKWHLGYEPGETPADRGFTRSFVLLDPGASHFADMKGYGPARPVAAYQDDGVPVESLPEDFYSSVAYTDHMIEYVREAAESDALFFGYLTYTAPHWPIHALPEDMERTRGRYDEGWDVLRQRRFERWKELGFAAPDAPEPALVSTYRPWDSLTVEEKALESRKMEAYAAMVERMDAEIGRLVDVLRETGQLDNTVIMFMADNGAEYIGQDWGGGMSEYFATFDNSLENIGHPGSYLMPGPGWGEAGSAPYFLSKGFLADGGVHVPAFVSAPALGLEAGRSDALIAAFDVAPTFVELAGADPAAYAGQDVEPMTGRSFAAVLRGEPGAARSDDEIVNFEHGGQRASIKGDWKALRINPPNGTGEWQLFNLASDPAESVDLADEYPDLLAELTASHDAFSAEVGVVAGVGAFTAPPPGASAATDGE